MKFSKTKIIIAASIIVLLLLALLFFIAKPSMLQPENKKAALKIEAELKSKYSQDFKVKNIGGGYGTYDNSTLKATVYPISDPSLLFKTEIKKDLSSVSDYYVSALTERTVEKTVSDSLNKKQKVLVRAWTEDTGATGARPSKDLGTPGINPIEYYKNNTDRGLVLFFCFEGTLDSVTMKSLGQSAAQEIQKVAGRGRAMVYFATQKEYASMVSAPRDQQLNDFWHVTFSAKERRFIFVTSSQSAPIEERDAS